MALKKYILKIEFDDNGDNCEFIEEKVIDDSPDKVSIGEIDIDEYFSATDIAGITKDNIGKT